MGNESESDESLENSSQSENEWDKIGESDNQSEESNSTPKKILKLDQKQISLLTETKNILRKNIF